MAILKIKQIRQMKPEDLDKKLNELELELAKEYGNVKMGRPVKNPGRIGEIKRAIARIKTVKNERKEKRKQNA